MRETLAEQVLPSQSDNSPWPLGVTVATIDAAVQREVDAVLAQDNAQGLNTRALLVVKGGKILGEAYSD